MSKNCLFMSDMSETTIKNNLQQNKKKTVEAFVNENLSFHFLGNFKAQRKKYNNKSVHLGQIYLIQELKKKL